MDESSYILSAAPGSYYAGPDEPERFVDDPQKAMPFESAAQAWRAAKQLEDWQSEHVHGGPAVVHLYDEETGTVARLTDTDVPEYVLRPLWRDVLKTPLPLDIPRAPQTPEVARTRLSHYLRDADWDGVRARGGDSFGFDPSFWREADKLFQSDKTAFRVLWSAAAPADIAPPDLSSPRWRAALEGTDNSEEPNEVVAEPASLGMPNGSNDPEPALGQQAASPRAKPTEALPAYVARHFVESRGAFYYKQRPDVLAFSVRGQSFRARDDSVMSATAIIALAQQRGWSAVRVRGSSSFRRAVWTAATEHGMQVFGYSPTRGESAVLAQSASPDGHPARPAGPSGDAKRAASVRAADPSLTGVLIDMGEAPYRHDRTNAESFFVTLRDSDGKEHTHWGVGLRKAIEQAGVTPGQRVALQRLGTESVQVKRPVLDEKGEVSFRKSEVVERRLWGVRVLEQAPEAPPAAADTPTPRRASADPDLAKALALIEQRMPQLTEALRLELRQRFDAAYAHLSKPATRNATVRDQAAQSVSRSARGR